MPSKRDLHRRALRPLLIAALHSDGLLSPDQLKLAQYSVMPRLRANLYDPDVTALEDYLIDHSELPGRRANLELAGAFADAVAGLCRDSSLSLARSYVAQQWLLWHLVHRYPPAVYGEDQDSPLQMPQFCGLVAYGEWAAAFRHIESGVTMLLDQSSCVLWRMREAVAMGLQRMLRVEWPSTLRRLERSIIDADSYRWRAVVAAVAEPDLLREPQRAAIALDLHYGALAYLRRQPLAARQAAGLRVLRKALGYSLSVVVAAHPTGGFEQMLAWAAWDDPDISWVLRENTRKKRLSAWPEQVEALRSALR